MDEHTKPRYKLTHLSLSDTAALISGVVQGSGIAWSALIMFLIYIN